LVWVAREREAEAEFEWEVVICIFESRKDDGKRMEEVEVEPGRGCLTCVLSIALIRFLFCNVFCSSLSLSN